MPDPNQSFTPEASEAGDGGFAVASRKAERSFPTVPVAFAMLAVLVLLTVMVWAGRRHRATEGSPDALKPVAAYAANLKLSGLTMSEATSYSGGKSTFMDGHVTNSGPGTVTGITLQVLFASDGGGAPQLETVPMTLVRTREPYLDTEPVSAAPLQPRAEADFRLIFEGIRPEWNQATPEIHVVEVNTR